MSGRLPFSMQCGENGVMNRVEAIWWRVRVLAATSVVWMAMGAAAWARRNEPAPEQAEPGAGPWVLPYFLVILAVALGLLTVLRSARRSERAKPRQYGE